MLFQIKYTEEILSNSTQKLLWFENAYCRLRKKFYCVICYNFLAHFRSYRNAEIESGVLLVWRQPAVQCSSIAWSVPGAECVSGDTFCTTDITVPTLLDDGSSHSTVNPVLLLHETVLQQFFGVFDPLLLQPFNGLFSRTTWVSRYQKGKTNLDFTGARDSEWQWHQLSHMQVCTSLQTDNHASSPPLSFLQAGCPSCRPTNNDKALKA